MLVSPGYQTFMLFSSKFFSSASFFDNILLSQQHMSKISNFQNVSPRTSWQNIWPPARLSKEDNQVDWRVMLGPQQVIWEESIQVKYYGQTASKFQASNSTSRKIVWSFPRNHSSVVSFPRNHSSLQINDIWAGSNDVQLYCRQDSKC